MLQVEYPIELNINNVVCDFHLKNENEPSVKERVYEDEPKITVPMRVAATCQRSPFGQPAGATLGKKLTLWASSPPSINLKA